MSLNLMNKLIKILMFFCACFIIGGCDRSKSERIPKTSFTYVDWGSYQRFITDDSKPSKVIVSAAVLGYFPFSKGIFIVRQPIIFHDCKNRDTVTEVAENIEVLLLFYDEKDKAPEVFGNWKDVLSKNDINSEEIGLLEDHLKNVKKLNVKKANCS